MNKRSNSDVLEMPNYAPSEGSRYFHVPVSTLAYWTEEPNVVIKLASNHPPLLSFKNLAEFYVLEGLRKIHGVKLHRIREAVNDMKKNEGSVYPLADFDIKTDGKYVLFYRNSKLINATLHGQYEIEECIATYLKRVDRDPHGIARKIFPFMKKNELKTGSEPPRIVVIDPNVCFGLPVLCGSRITTAFLASRYRGGDSLPAIAKSYARPVGEIKEAIEWETGREIKDQAA